MAPADLHALPELGAWPGADSSDSCITVEAEWTDPGVMTDLCERAP